MPKVRFKRAGRWAVPGSPGAPQIEILNDGDVRNVPDSLAALVCVLDRGTIVPDVEPEPQPETAVKVGKSKSRKTGRTQKAEEPIKG